MGCPVLALHGVFETILNEPVIDTAKSIGGRFSFQTDWNAGNFTGIGYYQGAIGNGQRSDAASAYIPSSIANRQNLDILLNTRVTQLIQTANVCGKPAFLGVKFGTNPSDLHTLTAQPRAIALAEWNATKTGRLVDANAVALGFLRLPEASPALRPYGDPSSGPLSAHIELLFAVSSHSACRIDPV
ncbi:hypothetical protein BT96DRAFT_1007343 [Gymnopus androsaceus JB14]|uniref:Uncharacterized protein n=1 Tax=Gymnopus androsaceus JB14 TaxID=1447944 RepID=A0A6A4GHL8_9AGAR|nr:hypothetical protein BT96DRAFT_1007343 [Gymnopus androsaceus JB14]